MDTTTSSAPIAVARIARALTYLTYAFVLAALVILLLGFFLELLGANPHAPVQRHRLERSSTSRSC